MKNVIKVMLLIVCSGLFFMTVNAGAKEGVRSYKIGVVPWAGWSAVHVAEAMGFWSKRGVDVKVINLPNTQAIQSAMKKGILDISFEMVGSIVGLFMEGEPFVIIAETDWSNGGDKIIVKNDVDLATMKGKPLGVYWNLPSVTFFLNQYLSSQGLKLSDYKVVEMETSQLADKFISGLFSAIVSYDPDALRAQRQGNGKVVATSASYKGCIPEGMMMARQALQAMPKEDLLKIYKGYIEAANWLKAAENWQEYQNILNSRTFKDDAPYSEQDLKEMVDSVAIHDSAVMLERNSAGSGLESYLKELRLFLKENGMLKKEFTSKDIFDNTIILEALK